MKRSKRYKAGKSVIDRNVAYELKEGVKLLKQAATAKFDETVDVAIRLGVDPRKADQMVRGTVALPHGTGKSVRVLVLCKPPKDKEALEAGADMAGLEEYIKKIEEGWSDIDAIIATPDVMKDVGKLGRYLGRKGLMPNPKAGTVTNDVAEAVKELKAGRIEFRVDKHGNIHATIGKASFAEDALVENASALISQVVRLKPASAKGVYIKTMTISSAMGPGIQLDRSGFSRN